MLLTAVSELFLVIWIWPTVFCASAGWTLDTNRHLSKREATAHSLSSVVNHTGEPPLDTRLVEPPGVGRGQRGAIQPVEDLVLAEVEETPASTANLAQPVSNESGGDSLHPGVVVILALICVFLFVLLLVCAAVLVRYTVIQKKKGRLNLQKNAPRAEGSLWAEGARYSPATPQTLTYRQRTQPRRPASTDTTQASHISTEVYRALYPYSPTEDSQIRLNAGSLIEVVEKTEGWWRGFAGQHEGWFPANYVERVYEDSCVTLEDYTDDMGARHSRHLKTDRSLGHRSSSNNPSRESISIRGIDHVDFQAAKKRRVPRPKAPVPPVPPAGHMFAEVTQPMVSQDKSGNEADDEVQSEDELERRRSGSSGGEENLLQSIFNDLEKAWSKSQVSTPINKDYYKLEPLESSIQPIPLAESFGEDDSNAEQLLRISPNLTRQEEDETMVKTVAIDETSVKNVAVEETTVKTVVVDEAAIKPLVEDEDTYINSQHEMERAEIEEDMYINCQAERHMAEREEEAAQEEFEELHHDFDKILRDSASRQSTTVSPDSEGPIEQKNDSVQCLEVSYRALYSYVPRQRDELHITSGESLIHVNDLSQDWVQVRNASGQEGLVPSIYITKVDPNSPHHQGSRGQLRLPETPDSEDWDINDFDNEVDSDITAMEYVAIYDYNGQQEGDLVLRVGDIVLVMEMLESGWWKGYSMGREGWFPGTYVEMTSVGSTPNTPAATLTAPPSIFSEHTNGPGTADATTVKETLVDGDENKPPPLPTSPPPTDEELEELEQKLLEQKQQLEQEKAAHQEHSVPSHQHATENKTHIQGGSQHSAGITNRQSAAMSRRIKSSSLPPAPSAPGSCEAVSMHRKITTHNNFVSHVYADSDTTAGSESEASPPRPLLRPPVGFGGSDIGMTSTDESEPERFRFKLTKRFGKPKFVKIPKKLLPPAQRAGSIGKRAAPPVPGLRQLEISAPILQQTSDPMRIAASQELRVSFKEPGNSENSKKPETVRKDTPGNNSPGILKNRTSLIYRSPHGGSYVDIPQRNENVVTDEEHQCHIASNSGPVSQTNSRPVSQTSSRPVSQLSSGSVRSSASEGRSDQRQNTNSVIKEVTSLAGPSGSNKTYKTPPPRPKPISNTPMSAPNISKRANTRPPLKQSSSLSSTPSNQFSTKPIHRQSSVPISEQEVSRDPQPIRGRRKSHRPSAPPPPRPKIPPLPRPQGPPPGRVGAHGDGMHLERKQSNTHSEPDTLKDQPVELNGLDCTQSSTDIIMQPLTAQTENLVTRKSIIEEESVNQTQAVPKHYVDLNQSVQSAPGNLTFTFGRTGPQNRPATSQPNQFISSHLTESSDFDEVDCPGPEFEVIAMTNQSKRLHPGPRDSFRKYKKQIGGGKRSSFNEHKDFVNPKAQAQNRAKARTLPNTSSTISVREDEVLNHSHYDVPRSLTLDRSNCSETGPAKTQLGPWESPSKKNAPQRPPPPIASPGSPVKEINGRDEHNKSVPVKPPRKDKLRRSTEKYLASERGELSFEEDAIIRDIGETPSISTDASEPPRSSAEIVWI